MRALMPLLLCTASLGIAGTITNGVATYRTNALPNGEASTRPTIDFRPLGGTTTDHLVTNWWYYRVDGDSRERPIGTYTKAGGLGSITTTEVSAGDTSTFTVTERDGAANTRFTASLAVVLTSGSAVSMSFRVTNPTLAPLRISLFNYLDANIQNTATNDSATLFAPNVIQITDAGGLSYYHSAVSPAAYQVTAANTLRSRLLNTSINNLNNTGLSFGPGNYSGAWQWNLILAPSETATVFSVFSPQPLPPADIPEPSSLALVSLGAVLLAVFRARRLPRA